MSHLDILFLNRDRLIIFNVRLEFFRQGMHGIKNLR